MKETIKTVSTSCITGEISSKLELSTYREGWHDGFSAGEECKKYEIIEMLDDNSNAFRMVANFLRL